MKRRFISISASFLAFLLIMGPLRGADNDLKAVVMSAAKRLAEQHSCTWQTTVQAAAGPVRGFRAAGSLGGDPTTGQTETDGYTTIKQPGLQFVTKAGKAAVLIGDYWMSVDQAAARAGDGTQRGPSQFNSAAITGYQLPPAHV